MLIRLLTFKACTRTNISGDKAGRKIDRRLDDRRYLVQTALGYHADWSGLINTVEIADSSS